MYFMSVLVTTLHCWYHYVETKVMVCFKVGDLSNAPLKS